MCCRHPLIKLTFIKLNSILNWHICNWLPWQTVHEVERHRPKCKSAIPVDITETSCCFQTVVCWNPSLLRVILHQTEEGTNKKEEQQAAREQVLSLTLEIRSYQQLPVTLSKSVFPPNNFFQRFAMTFKLQTIRPPKGFTAKRFWNANMFCHNSESAEDHAPFLTPVTTGCAIRNVDPSFQCSYHQFQQSNKSLVKRSASSSNQINRCHKEMPSTFQPVRWFSLQTPS